jgi:hypothetical protein
MKVDLKGKNLLDLVPKKLVESEKREDGKSGELDLLLPRFNNPFFLKYFVPKRKSPYIKIKLDKLGTAFWELCDGNSTVYEIGIKLKETFGDTIEPTYERLRVFIQQLIKRDCLTLEEKKI